MIYRLWNKEQKRYATAEEMECLKPDPNGNGVLIDKHLYYTNYSYPNGVNGDLADGEYAWQTTDHYEVEWGFHMTTPGTKQYPGLDKKFYECDIISYSMPCLLPGRGENWGTTPEKKIVLLYVQDKYRLIGVPVELWKSKEQVLKDISSVHIVSSQYVDRFDMLIENCRNGKVTGNAHDEEVK